MSVVVGMGGGGELVGAGAFCFGVGVGGLWGLTTHAHCCRFILDGGAAAVTVIGERRPLAFTAADAVLDGWLAVVAGLIVPSYIKWVVGGIGRKDFLGDFLIWEAKKTMRKTTNEEKSEGRKKSFPITIFPHILTV
jgi:hypothetical protein